MMGAPGRVHAADSHDLIRMHRARVKLAIQKATDGGIYVLAEPTTSLHLAGYVGTGASTVDRRS